MFASVSIVVDPTWPWDTPIFGLPALAVLALVLVGLTIWTYAGVEKITRGRLLTILLLRLAALLVACTLVLRPSIAQQDDDATLPTRLLILVDSSESMSIADEFNNLSRWDRAKQILAAPAVQEALQKLTRENKIEIAYYQGAEGVQEVNRFDPAATGKRTDFGTWLHDLWQMHGRDGNLRGLLIFSDGADNGNRYDLQLTRWANVCPIFTFALGKPSTSLKQRDIAITDIAVPTEPLPVKTEFTVSGLVDAWGFKGSPVDVSLWIDDLSGAKPKLLGRTERERLRKDEKNEIKLTRDVPAVAGEYKVTLKVGNNAVDDKGELVVLPLPNEAFAHNNEISSYITVTKEGVSILWVEGHKRLESTFALRHALTREKRLRVYPAEKLSDTSAPDFFKFAEQKYDVIVIGDITASRFKSGEPDVFRQINRMVTQDGTGLMLIGGHDSFGSDWAEETDITSLLPAQMTNLGQVNEAVRMVPTNAGINEYLLKLDDDPARNKAIWAEWFDPLDGMTRIGTIDKPGPKDTIYARSPSGEPMLVGTQVGKGRVLVFGADTTWKAWRRTPEAVKAYERFWIRTMLWLAHQENIEGSAYVKPDMRRVVAGRDRKLGFEVGLRGKGGVKAQNPKYVVKIYGPGKSEFEVPTRPDGSVERGWFEKIGVPGEYRIEVDAKGLDANVMEGGKPKEIKGKASARFLIVTEDMESRRPAADHDFLGRLTRLGGGFAKEKLADEQRVLELLAEIKAHKTRQPHVERWPDWRRNPPPPLPGQSTPIGEQIATLWNSAALPCLIAFVGFLSLEWYLRRRWELV